MKEFYNIKIVYVTELFCGEATKLECFGLGKLFLRAHNTQSNDTCPNDQICDINCHSFALSFSVSFMPGLHYTKCFQAEYPNT